MAKGGRARTVDRERILDLYAARYSWDAIATDVHCSKATIARAVVQARQQGDARAAARPVAKRRRVDRERIVKLYAARWSWEAIAAEVGCSKATIELALDEARQRRDARATSRQRRTKAKRVWRRLLLPADVDSSLRAAAVQHECSPETLLARISVAVFREDLLGAVLDDAPMRAPRATRQSTEAAR
jgi:AraC-like DNA-binding protein